MLIKKWAVLLLSFSILFLGISSVDASNGDSRLGIFVKSEVLKKHLGKFYYRNPKVECWLDGEIIYKGSLKKGDMNARIFNELISPGDHVLKFKWKARVRGDEAARVKLGGRRVVDWVHIPEEGFAEYTFNIKPVQTKVVEIKVSREFGILKNKGEVTFREGIWKE